MAKKFWGARADAHLKKLKNRPLRSSKTVINFDERSEDEKDLSEQEIVLEQKRKLIEKYGENSAVGQIVYNKRKIESIEASLPSSPNSKITKNSKMNKKSKIWDHFTFVKVEK
ncbi:hypothetical protein ROZALSC1DRAFT_30927, partial [Rozella allomycis CSF55]